MATTRSIPEILDSAAERLAAESSASLTHAFLSAAGLSVAAASDAQRALVRHLGLQSAGNVATDILAVWASDADYDGARIATAMREAAAALRNGGV